MPNMDPVDPEEVKRLDSIALLLTSESEPVRFYFNPNTTSKDSLQLLGFPEYIAARIVNYRDKGGRFRTKDDLREIYGISNELVDHIYDWIDLPEKRIASGASASSSIDINLATVDQLKGLISIGDAYAGRILKYRELLGGFVSKNQFTEIYGLSDEALVNLTSSTFIHKEFTPQLLRINYSDFEGLVRHPYISRELASDIMQYREVNSTIESEKVLAVFKSIDKSNFEKLILYLDFQ